MSRTEREVLLADIRVLLRVLLPAFLAVALAACGGGGGGSPNPVLGTLSFTTNENVALTGALSATDPGGSKVTFTQTGNPTSGTVSGFTPAGAFVYTPKPNFVGSDSFAIQAADASGNMTMGTVSVTVTQNTPPTASNTVLRADGTALASVNVLKNANDPDKDPLTVTILSGPTAGTATVNSDGSVNLAGLSSFKGVTTFTYQVTDPSGATAKAAAAIFVGTDPFRAAYVADAAGNGSNEVYLTDLAAQPAVMTAATQGNLRLKGFAISDNGATIVYRTQDTTSAANTSLSFVKTSAPAQATPVPLPSGTVPIADGNGNDQYLLSPDGQWIAFIAGQGSLSSLYVVNIAQPTTASQIQPAGVTSVGLPTFTLDSKSIYFLANSSSGTHRSLYFASLSKPGTDHADFRVERSRDHQ
jgi:Tol biopolymer transport system component